MHTNTAGVNRKWAELQGEGSALRFVLERKAKFKNNLQKCVKEKERKEERSNINVSVWASCSWLVVSFISPTWGSTLLLSAHQWLFPGHPAQTCPTLSLAFMY